METELIFIPKSIAENSTIGTTQFRSIRKPNTRFPTSAPVRPNVRDSAAAITLNRSVRALHI